MSVENFHSYLPSNKLAYPESMDSNIYIQAPPWYNWTNIHHYSEERASGSSDMTVYPPPDAHLHGGWYHVKTEPSIMMYKEAQNYHQHNDHIASSCTTPSSYTSPSGSEWHFSEASSRNASNISSGPILSAYDRATPTSLSDFEDQQAVTCGPIDRFGHRAEPSLWDPALNDMQSSFQGFEHAIPELGMKSLDSSLSMVQHPSAPEEVNVSQKQAQNGEIESLSHQGTNSADIVAIAVRESAQDDQLLSDVEDEEGSSYSTPKKKQARKSRAASVSKASPKRSRRKSDSQLAPNSRGIVKRRNSSNRGINKERRPSKGSKGPVFLSALRQQARQGGYSYPCVFRRYGCSHEFANKNEWKRHVSCQHLRLGFYRCDLGNCDPDNASQSTNSSRRQSSQILAKQSKDSNQGKVWNLFYRKDLFTQHCRRMHGPSRDPGLCTGQPKRGVPQPTDRDEARFEQDLENIRARCWEQRRPPPTRSNCDFCDQVFDEYYFRDSVQPPITPEEKAWEQRMEHIAQHHIEKGHEPLEHPEEDVDLVEWGLKHEVFQKLDDGRCWLIDVPSSSSNSEPGARAQEDDGLQRRRSSRTAASRRRSVHFQVRGATDDDSDAEAEDE